MPVVVLIIACIIGLLYTGGFFERREYLLSSRLCQLLDASIGLVPGVLIVALVFAIIYFIARRVLSLQAVHGLHPRRALRPWFPPSSF